MISKLPETKTALPLCRVYATVICLLWLLAAMPSHAQETQEKIDIDNVSRTFILHLPQGYNDQQRYPLVILLHGQNQDADDMGRLTRSHRTLVSNPCP